MTAPTFVAASEAAAEALELMATADSMVNRGELEEARKVLQALAAFERLHGPTLDAMKLELAAVADGPVTQFAANGQRRSYASGHEAVAANCTLLLVLVDQGDWQPPAELLAYLGIDVSALGAALVRERAKLVPPTSVAGGKKKGGRPGKNDKPLDVKVIAALCDWHKYDNGSIGNHEPATNRGLAERYGLATNALTRFARSTKQLGDVKAYRAACANGNIGTYLMVWQRETPNRLAPLSNDE